MSRKIFLSFLSGLAVLVITWVYQNYSFTFSVEDSFISKLSFWKYKIFSSHPQQKANFVFINTGKSLALVSDTLDYGNVAVSNREEIYNVLHFIDSMQNKPVFTVVDIQFYYPYTINPGIDSLMQDELNKNSRLLIAVLPENSHNDLEYKKPLYNSIYAYSEYQTYGTSFNKFRIINHGNVPSIPVVLDEMINKSIYKDHSAYATCNGHLCMSAIWPNFYLNDNDIRSNKSTYAQFYNIGEIYTDMQTNPGNYKNFFQDKIVIVGNFELDTHLTPVGPMAGSVIVANIYLSLLNKHHIVSYIFLFILLMVFTALSYLSWFSKVPEVKIRFNFIFSPHLVHFIKSYISYFGSMFFLSVIAVLFFNMQVALFLPAFVFSVIEYFRQKKYLPEK